MDRAVTISQINPAYMGAPLKHAQFEPCHDGYWYFASIPLLPGLWARGRSKAKARDKLFLALNDWIFAHAGISKQPVPDIDGVSFYL